MSLFNKEFKYLSKSDIEDLINEKYPEDLHVEYKGKLPCNKGNDPWYKDQKKIGDKARNEILEEVIAFANSDGGFLIIGIEETKNKPPRADRVNYLPEVNALAERIKYQIRDCVEPKIPNYSVRGIECDGKGGFLIVRVERSYLGPHRSLPSKECYVRRNDSNDKMTMREIKDLTMTNYNYHKNLQDRFLKRKEEFNYNFQFGRIPYKNQFGKNEGSGRIGFRITFLPISNLVQFQNLIEAVKVTDTYSKLYLANKDFENITSKFQPNSIRPIIRGILCYGDELNVTINENGLIEYIAVVDGKDGDLRIDAKWLIQCCYSGAMLLEKLKESNNVFDNEFAIEVELVSTPNQFTGITFFHNKYSDISIINEKSVLFPRYSYKESEDIGKLLNYINIDFTNMCGINEEKQIILQE